ncbi:MULTISPECIES: DUF3231 family protein [Neobacillus]|uniref:DUF3231 family protein n=1 Tax=Neobacillus rhizophilus TaxID=2833579 RepID=A0A942YWE4_9BACI|nr:MULTISPECIES: DUF3231 family protein [Neobacillus]MBS4214887.1 DUF3231 family protein [Neobacillus rhizophilus]MBU8918877.1 DUF3231 family protein [Bacillus sp. FJAT-29953]
MDTEKLKLSSSEIGSLWGEYVNGTAIDIVNKYMYSIIEDKAIKAVFNDALKTFEKQKRQIITFIENEGFPVPIGFNESDLYLGKQRLFSDAFCLNYLHVMTLHGLLGHTTALSISVRKDLRDFYDSCDNDAKKLYHQTIELLLDKGLFQRDPLFYADEHPKYISSNDFKDGIFGKGRTLTAIEIISISFNLKKSIMAKTLSIAFSQVAESKEVRKFLTESEKTADGQIKALAKILQADNLPVPKSLETEVTISTDSPFSDKLLMYHTGFLFQTAQTYYGAGLASAMRTDLVTTYEGTILQNLMVTNNWFNIMVKNKWLEQPPLAPNRTEIAKQK